jgi:hypothetical protein
MAAAPDSAVGPFSFAGPDQLAGATPPGVLHIVYEVFRGGAL